MRIAIFQHHYHSKKYCDWFVADLMIQTMGEENYSESFYLSIYIMKVYFFFDRSLGNKRRPYDIVAFIRQR